MTISLFKYTDTEKNKLLSSMVILVDTREKKNDHIVSVLEEKGIPYKQKKLDYGDYSFMIPKNEELGIYRDIWFDKKVVVERKASLEELSGNLTQNRNRFEEEMALSPEEKVLIIENSQYSDIINHNYDTKYNKKSFLSTIHAFWFRYDCPFVFMPNASETVIFIKYYFENYLKNYMR